MGKDTESTELTGDLEALRQDGFPASALFASSVTAVLLVDVVTERIIAINPAALGLLAARQQELQGCEWPLAFAPTCEQAVRTAITQAVAAAGERDAILIAGKGHEDYQIIGTTKTPFDDVAVARAALEVWA